MGTHRGQHSRSGSEPSGARPTRGHGMRHGRGMRGELLLGDVPARMTRREAFDTQVARVFADIQDRASGTLDHVQLATDMLPPLIRGELGPQPPIAVTFPADKRRRDTIVAYRAPLLRMPPDEAASLLEVELATQAARLCAYSVDDLLGQ